MKEITAFEFLAMITENPSVFEHWDTPLEITEYVNCYGSRITHLSKHLKFLGRNPDGESASFYKCQSLTLATGNFKGHVSFEYSAVEKIKNLITGKRDTGWFADFSADFTGCKSLQIATGNYPGFVNFSSSGIHKIHNLHIENPNSSRIYTNFLDCPNLKTLEGWDLSKQSWVEDHKLEAEKKRRAALKNFHTERKIESLPFL
jgi:hypothetical protein